MKYLVKNRLFTLSVGLACLGLGNSTTAAMALPIHSIAQSNNPSSGQPWYNCLTREVWTPEKQAWCDRLNQLQNMEYTLPDFGTVSLSNGTYENREQRFTVTLVNQEGWLAAGDLDGDGNEDAVVLLGVTSGASGQFTYLVPVLNQGTTLQPLAATFLGDRVKINSLTVASQQITLNMVTQGPDDPMCCPTLEVTRIYQLQPTLVQVGGDPATPMPLPAPLPSDSTRSDETINESIDEPMPATDRVTGTVNYRQRIALPPNAIVEVSLLDVSRQDVAATVISSQTIPLEGKQVPVAFELPFNPDTIDERYSYAVQARILVDGELRFINTSRYPVITHGSPTEVEVWVNAVN